MRAILASDADLQALLRHPRAGQRPKRVHITSDYKAHLGKAKTWILLRALPYPTAIGPAIVAWSVFLYVLCTTGAAWSQFGIAAGVAALSGLGAACALFAIVAVLRWTALRVIAQTLHARTDQRPPAFTPRRKVVA